MHLFGLTGGIATGKSTVAARLRERGVPVIDADELAREVVAPGSDGLRAVVGAFGQDVVDAAGALDRKALGRRVFADAEARRRLNAIVHPAIARRMLERAAELAAGGTPLAAYDAALIVENGAADAFRPLVVVTCPEAVQLERLRARDALSFDEARARVASQGPAAVKLAAADYVIDTGGTLAETRARTDEVLEALRRQLGT